MSDASSALESLPFEIIQSIAGFVPACSLPSLCQASRTLHQVCYDGLVFRSCLENESLRMYIKNGRRHLVPIDVDALASICGSDARLWSRFAVANSRACATGNRSNRTSATHGGIEYMKNYVPHLIISGNAWLISSSARDAASMLDDPHSPLFKRNPDDVLMASTSLNRALDDSLSAFWLCAAALDANRTINRHETNYMNDLFLFRMADPKRNGVTVASTMGNMAAWAWLLYDYLELLPRGPGFDNEQPASDIAARYPPTLQDMPWFGDLKSGARIPLPFATRNDGHLLNPRLCLWDEWIEDATQRVIDLLTADGITWVGYWSFGRHRRLGVPRVEFADAIEELTLSSPDGVPNERVPSGSRILIGTYPPHVVDFRLEGYVTPRGRFRLGPPGDFWACYGHVTPFGLFGFWGSADGSQSAGATWLWPSTWTKESNRKRKAQRSTSTAAASSPQNDDASSDSDSDFGQATILMAHEE